MSDAAGQVAVYIEAGKRRVFASALEWPGWARSGRSEALAIAALAEYLPRYEPIVRRAGLAPPAGVLAVTERHAGQAKYADFGSLGEIAASESRLVTAAEGARLAALLEAAWAAFGETAAQAPAQLRKGPRGGGRDTAAVVGHVLGAEAMYARKIGLPRDKGLAPDAAAAGLRARISALLRAPAELAAPASWPLSYAARRLAWHVLDHLWEIEDKSE
jgi:hypothetical protein